MKELKVTPIRNGTVIDHISVGMALKVLKIIGVREDVSSTVSVLMHVPIKKAGWKDIVKIRTGPDPLRLPQSARVFPVRVRSDGRVPAQRTKSFCRSSCPRKASPSARCAGLPNRFCTRIE